jgi:hypothetical protein
MLNLYGRVLDLEIIGQCAIVHFSTRRMAESTVRSLTQNQTFGVYSARPVESQTFNPPIKAGEKADAKDAGTVRWCLAHWFVSESNYIKLRFHAVKCLMQ